MSSGDRVIQSQRVVLQDGIRPAAIAIRHGLISHIGTPGEFGGINVSDYGDAVIMPGIVDTHVHINEPGRAEWEGFETATMAAAAGGVTTLIDMPLNSIPAVTSRAALREKVAAAQRKLFVDVGFWGGVVPGNTGELKDMYADGVFGYKCFLVPSGVPEFECVRESELRQALPELARLDALLLAHAELPGPLDAADRSTIGKDPTVYTTWLDSRPAAAEDDAIELLIRLADEYKARIHIVHLSSASAVATIRAGRQRKIQITTETCPHYLTIAAEDIPPRATQFKCAPPIRNRANQEHLWEALRTGLIDCVVTDHSPAPPRMKCTDTGDYLRAWGGIASLQLSLPLLWTSARARGFSIVDIWKWLCFGPAKLARLPQKSEIKAGNDADFVIWHPEAKFEVRPEKLCFRHRLTPYATRTLSGVVRATFLRGQEIYNNNEFPSPRFGRVLRRA